MDSIHALLRMVLFALIVCALVWAWTMPSTDCGMTGLCTGLSAP